MARPVHITSTHKKKRNHERGIALFIALFALLILSAIATGMMFMADTETAVNLNYRDAQSAYFGSMAGLEEARERLRASSTNAITAPTGMPSTSTATNVIYIINPGVAYGGGVETAASIQPWNPANAYFDDELCHENFSGLSLTNPGYNIPCSAGAPTGSYSTITSVSPGTGTAAALNFKWVRITLKQNGSTPPYYVNLSNSSSNLSTQVCWDGTQERLINGASLQELAPTEDRLAQNLQQVASLPAVAWFGRGGNTSGSGHSTGSTTGTTTTGTTTTGTTTTGTTTTGTTTTGTTTTGTTTTGTTTTGTTTTGTTTTGTTTTGTTTTGTTTTGTTTTGTTTTGTTTTGTTTTGTTTTGTTTTGTTTTGTTTTGTTTTGTTTTGTTTTGTTTTGTTTTGTTTTGTTTTGTTTGTTTTGSSGLSAGVPTSPDTCQQQSGSLYAVYQVTSMAVTPSGARRVSQHEIAKSIIQLNLPGALTFDGPAPTYNPSTSNVFSITGNQPTTGADACTSGSNTPAVAATDASGEAYLNTTITGSNPNRSTAYTGANCDIAVPCVSNTSASMALNTPDLSTIAGLNALVATIDSNADQRVTGANQVANWGTSTDPQIIIVRGDVTIPSGYGILVVTGTATFSGSSNWHGAVLVIGDGILQKNGGGGGQTEGGMLVANTNCSNSPNAQGVRATCTPIPSTQTTPGPPFIDWNGGGAANIQYNSCALNNAGTRPLFRLISFRELTY